VTVTSLEPFSSTAETFVDLLASLGYRASLRVIPEDQYAKLFKYDRIQAGLWGWGADFPGQATFIPDLVSCDARLPYQVFNVSLFCDPEIDRRIEAAEKRQVSDPAGAPALWAEIDKAVVDEAPIIPFSNSVSYDFTSPRVGNYQHHPHYGLLPAQMWVQ
jgi:peptide/nickel transport system substrate-binding protein